jgi:hypothetical protein
MIVSTKESRTISNEERGNASSFVIIRCVKRKEKHITTKEG